MAKIRVRISYRSLVGNKLTIRKSALKETAGVSETMDARIQGLQQTRHTFWQVPRRNMHVSKRYSKFHLDLAGPLTPTWMSSKKQMWPLDSEMGRSFINARKRFKAIFLNL